MTRTVYWLSAVPAEDDFGNPIRDTFIDGKTRMGPWAIMTPASWGMYGIGRLGLGCGQMYEKRTGDVPTHKRWIKIDG